VDLWWSGLARALRAEGIAEVPERLDRGVSFDALWSAPDLLFAQACGFPLVGEWSDRLQYVATPRYAAPGCTGADYCSWIVVPANSRAATIEDLRGARCSINGRVSHSGYNALRALFAPLARDGRFFGAVSVSGGHAESIEQLGRGEIDAAAIDCVSHALFSRCRPQAIAATRIVGRTSQAPGLPYVTRIDADRERVARLRAGVLRAFADPALAAVREALLLTGVDVLPASRYRLMTRMARDARRRNYVELD
ncbi:MAG: PhnD/SsuA/transferrin family substrate-binding protein, partial [Casimicrobiaceae bacterium]